MKYSDGTDVRINDNVLCPDGLIGTVVFSIDTQEYSEQFPENNWSYLAKGIMVETTEAGLVHYQDETCVFVRSALPE